MFRDWVAESSEGIEIRPDPNAEARFLSVIVVADAPPSLRVVTPGKDRAFATAVGQVAIQVDSSDDIGLATMSLRFTKASGGGENLAFTEGDVPLAIDRRTERNWIGRASLSLDALGLADGDILVYRAIARDTNPNGAPVQSEQYLIEIGRNSQIADAGFALPTEEKKYAISQQMVIYKTEQLLQVAGAASAGDGRPGSLEQTRKIAMEQRMVRAEVVFLGGGEVEDEVEEAAQSHELTEGPSAEHRPRRNDAGDQRDVARRSAVERRPGQGGAGVRAPSAGQPRARARSAAILLAHAARSIAHRRDAPVDRHPRRRALVAA